ncbi:hypothetical protein [Cellvibrio mixtus]|uniref:hypothetical protein n=1 Tax=Cellvibrio mixtus TaxID=39650 RepID=UPI00113FC4D2|nr:hypothetical protein [Cellvibrio mixtus]
MKKVLAIVSSVLILNCAEAATWTNGNQAVDATIWRPGYHGFYVTQQNFHDPEGCSTSPTQYLYLFDPAFESSDPKTVDRLYSMILTAQSTGKKLNVFVDGCLGVFPKITGLQLNK